MHLIKDENGNMVSHGHAHTHDHTHGHGEAHSHEHTHEHGHEEEHSHSHAHECCGCKEGECKGGCSDEVVALLKYMLSHNEQHAQELDQMADNLSKLGMDDAAKTIKEGVSDFQKGNMRLGLALTLVNEHVKEAD